MVYSVMLGLGFQLVLILMMTGNDRMSDVCSVYTIRFNCW